MGAVAGTVLTAFYFIPAVGIEVILYWAGALNLAIGVTAIAVGMAIKGPMAETETPEDTVPPVPDVGEGERQKEAGDLPGYYSRLIVWGFAVSGFTALAYEVIWTRILGFILTGTIYAFATVLATFLCGIAVGSFVFSRVLDRLKSMGSLITLLASVEVLIGLTSMGLILLFYNMPGFDFYYKVDSTPVWGEFVYLNFFISFISLFVPTFFFGATFPLVCKIYSRRMDDVGTRVGDVYSVNTAGGILGSFASGFILIPLVGMQTSLVLMAFINVGMGVLFIIFNPYTVKRRWVYTVYAGAAAVVIILILLPENMPKSLHEGLLSRGERMLFYEEGPAATVMIAERTGQDLESSNKRLWINGNRATAAYYEGLQINRFQGVLPMVLHPNPKDVLVICFGSGTTFGTLSQFDVKGVDNVEISRTVIKGAPIFTSENKDVLNNPKSTIIIDDGRSYLEVATKKYDVITQEPMHPLLSGVVNLYTREYYELAKAHLKEDGIISQWIPLYNLSVEDVRMLVSTFQFVFPHTTVWLANTDIFMIGSPSRTYIDYGYLESRLMPPNVQALLRQIDLEDPLEFLSTFMMHEEQVRAYSAGAPVITDDLPVVEFTGPRSLNVNTVSPNLAELLRYREPVVPYLNVEDETKRNELIGALSTKFRAGRHNIIGRAYYADGNFEKALEYFRTALGIDPVDRNSIHYKHKLRLYSRDSPHGPLSQTEMTSPR
jgi:spermidine synthase